MEGKGLDMKRFRVVIAGSRSFSDYDSLKTICDKVLSNKSIDHQIVIVSGMAIGADILGKRYGEERGYEVMEFPADWKTYGKRAGIIRNQQMLDHADAVICFWDSKSNGTKHMMTIAQMHSKPLRVIRF
jgi:hypothetical protein